MDFKQFCKLAYDYFDINALKNAFMVGAFPGKVIKKSKTPGEFYGIFFTWLLKVIFFIPFLLTMYSIFVVYKAVLYPLPIGIFKLCTAGNKEEAPKAPIVPPNEIQRYINSTSQETILTPQGNINARPTVSKQPNQNFPNVE